MSGLDNPPKSNVREKYKKWQVIAYAGLDSRCSLKDFGVIGNAGLTVARLIFERLAGIY